MVGTTFSVPEALLEHQEAGEQGLTEQRGSHLAVSPAISAAPLLVPYSTQHLGHKGYVQSGSLALVTVQRRESEELGKLEIFCLLPEEVGATHVV